MKLNRQACLPLKIRFFLKKNGAEQLVMVIKVVNFGKEKRDFFQRQVILLP